MWVRPWSYFCSCLVDRHEVLVGRDLRQKALGDDIIVAGVSGIVPIVYHLVEHCAGFPPIVWVRQ